MRRWPPTASPARLPREGSFLASHPPFEGEDSSGKSSRSDRKGRRAAGPPLTSELHAQARFIPPRLLPSRRLAECGADAIGTHLLIGLAAVVVIRIGDHQQPPCIRIGDRSDSCVAVD